MSTLFSPIKQMLANEPVTFTEKGLSDMKRFKWPTDVKWYIHAIHDDRQLSLISEYTQVIDGVKLDDIEHPHAKTPLWMLQHIMSMCEDADNMFDDLSNTREDINLDQQMILDEIREQCGQFGITLEEIIKRNKNLLTKLSS